MPTQSQPQQKNQAQPDTTRIAALMRSGLMKSSDLPRLKIALRRQAQTGDVARLSKQHRDVLQQYYGALSGAALGSQQSYQAVRKNLMQHNEIEGDELLVEAPALKDELNPPFMLVLKRRGIRIFPDGKRVALYTNDRLGLTFTIPYSPTGSSAKEILPGVQAEEVDINEENIEENIEHIKDIVDKHQAKKLKFLDGSSMNVDATTAKAIHLVHGALNNENKAKVARMLTHSKGQFMKVADFAMKNTAFKTDK